MNFKKREKTEFIIHYRYPSDKKTLGKQEIDRAQRATGGFGIGYHFVVRRDGVVEEGRKVSVMGSHHEDYNHNSIAVCTVGSDCTPQQAEALDALFEELKGMYPDAELIGPSEP
jgi:N-acetylmuramoyl-L-alanine amidase